MRIIVFFDLPVTTRVEKKEAAKFRRFLLKDGYFMIQFSVYCRICNGNDAVEKHKQRLRVDKSSNGSVRMLTITEKQYEKIELVVGNLKKNDTEEFIQLSIF